MAPFTPEQPESPLTFLHEQRDALGVKTAQLLQGHLEQHTTTRHHNLPWYVHSLFVVAPVLN